MSADGVWGQAFELRERGYLDVLARLEQQHQEQQQQQEQHGVA